MNIVNGKLMFLDQMYNVANRYTQLSEINESTLQYTNTVCGDQMTASVALVEQTTGTNTKSSTTAAITAFLVEVYVYTDEVIPNSFTDGTFGLTGLGVGSKYVSNQTSYTCAAPDPISNNFNLPATPVVSVPIYLNGTNMVFTGFAYNPCLDRIWVNNSLIINETLMADTNISATFTESGGAAILTLHTSNTTFFGNTQGVTNLTYNASSYPWFFNFWVNNTYRVL